jgi:hypothetical protein
MDDTAALRNSAPLSFWIISAISMLWNGFGGYDYVMTRSRNSDYLSQMGDPKDILAWIDSMPVWSQYLWPIGVWASVLGSVLLLLRSRYAVPAFLVSLVGAIGSFAAQMATTLPASMDNAMNKMMPLVILAVIVFLWWYAKKALAQGVLK